MKKQITNTQGTKRKYPLVKFLLIVVGAGLFGAVIGILMGFIGDSTGTIGNAIVLFLEQVLPVGIWVFFAVMTVLSLALFGMARTAVFAFEKGGSTNEALESRADSLISIGMLCSSINQIGCYGLFGMIMALPKKLPVVLSTLLVILLVMVLCTAYSVHAIKLIKRINPEKQGNPLELQFQKDWTNSCDEAEKMLIYRASHSAMSIVSAVTMILWVFTVLVCMFWDIGVFPVVLVTIIWLAQTIGYQLSVIRLSKKKREP